MRWIAVGFALASAPGCRATPAPPAAPAGVTPAGARSSTPHRHPALETSSISGPFASLAAYCEQEAKREFAVEMCDVDGTIGLAEEWQFGKPWILPPPWNEARLIGRLEDIGKGAFEGDLDLAFRLDTGWYVEREMASVLPTPHGGSYPKAIEVTAVDIVPGGAKELMIRTVSETDDIDPEQGVTIFGKRSCLHVFGIGPSGEPRYTQWVCPRSRYAIEDSDGGPVEIGAADMGSWSVTAEFEGGNLVVSSPIGETDPLVVPPVGLHPIEFP